MLNLKVTISGGTLPLAPLDTFHYVINDGPLLEGPGLEYRGRVECMVGESTEGGGEAFAYKFKGENPVEHRDCLSFEFSDYPVRLLIITVAGKFDYYRAPQDLRWDTIA